MLPSLPKAQPNQSLGESPAPCLLVSCNELAPLRPEDFELILLGSWGIDLITCLLSLRGRLWRTPRELQLHSLQWTSVVATLRKGLSFHVLYVALTNSEKTKKMRLSSRHNFFCKYKIFLGIEDPSYLWKKKENYLISKMTLYGG